MEGIKKITHAMEMVSAARMRPLQRLLSSQEEYFSRIEDLLFRVLGGCEDIQHLLLSDKKNKQRRLICIFSSDTGLCGNYNGALISKAEDFIIQNQGFQTSLLIVGRKGLNHFKKRGLSIENSYAELYGHYSSELANKVSREIIAIFLSGKIDEVYAVYTTPLRHEPVIEKILNVERKNNERVEYITEPDREKILDRLIPLYVSAKIGIILLRSFAAENSSRTMAMHEATNNAKDLLDDLVLARNKIRQGGITTEIIDIISAVNAMKG